MRFQIDTVAKTIKLEQSAKITEILSIVKKLLPNDWKEYSLETNTTIYNWQNPIYIPYVPPYNPNPFYVTSVWQTEFDAGSTLTTTSADNAGIFNFEVAAN